MHLMPMFLMPMARNPQIIIEVVKAISSKNLGPARPHHLCDLPALYIELEHKQSIKISMLAYGYNCTPGVIEVPVKAGPDL